MVESIQNSEFTKFPFPCMPFDVFKDKMIAMWNEAWFREELEDPKRYIDMLLENPTGYPEDELQRINYAYIMYVYCWKVFHGIRRGEEARVRTEVIVPFQGTNLDLILDEVGIRVLKTVYGTKENFISSVPDFDIANLITLKDGEGKRRIDFFYELDSTEISTLCLTFGSHIFVLHAWDYVDTLSAAEVMDQNLIENLEHRAMCLSVPSVANELRDYLNKINTFVDTKDKDNPSVYTLYKSSPGFLGIETPVAYVSCICPSTGRSFMLSCSSEHENAKDAIASLLMVPHELIPNIHQISRQGEIFLITFDIDVESIEFKKKMKSRRVGLDGELYFSKLVYES